MRGNKWSALNHILTHILKSEFIVQCQEFCICGYWKHQEVQTKRGAQNDCHGYLEKWLRNYLLESEISVVAAQINV
jgi:hypothetical protein